MDGTASPIINGIEHAVNLGQTSGNKGAWHNHTQGGIMTFSPSDIAKKLMSFVSTLPVGSNYGDAFFGVIGSEPSGSCPQGWCYRNYIIRFTGNQQDISNIMDTNFDVSNLNLKQKEIQLAVMSRPENTVSSFSNVLKDEGLEKVFFQTLEIMNLNNKIALQRISKNGNEFEIFNITQNMDGSVDAIPCL